MERQHGAKSREGGLGIGALPVTGVVGHVGLDKSKFEFAVAKRLDVINRASSPSSSECRSRAGSG
jgi:hypothetical protein